MDNAQRGRIAYNLWIRRFFIAPVAYICTQLLYLLNHFNYQVILRQAVSLRIHEPWFVKLCGALYVPSK